MVWVDERLPRHLDNQSWPFLNHMIKELFMNPIVEINETVNVIASFVSNNRHVQVKPVRMRHHGRDITFTQLGLCHPVRHGSQLHYIFDVSDGANDYTLDFDTTTLVWTLVSMIDGGSL